MSLVNNLQILFKLNGQCDLIKDGHDTFVRVWNHDELFCYQGWDLKTYKLNALKRKTFTIPVTQFVNAANNFNHFNPQNNYQPSLVMTLENNNVAVVTATEFSIEPYSNANPVETLKIKILENYEKIVDKDHIKLRKQNDLSEDLKFSQSKKMNFMFSEMSYKQLNFNNYLTQKGVVHTDKELSRYIDHWLDLSNLCDLKGLNFKSYNYLFQNIGMVKKTHNGFKIIVENPSHILKFQGWHEYSGACNHAVKRDMHAITATKFMMKMYESIEIAENKFGSSPENFAFQPTCYIEIVNKDDSNIKSEYIGVMKSFVMDNNFSFLSNNTSKLEIHISLDQIDTGVLGNQRLHELQNKEYFIRMNIDAAAESDGQPRVEPRLMSNDKDAKGNTIYDDVVGTTKVSHTELCDLTILYNNALVYYDMLQNPTEYPDYMKDKRGNFLPAISEKDAAKKASTWFTQVVRQGYWRDSSSQAINNIYNVDVTGLKRNNTDANGNIISAADFSDCTPPVPKDNCQNQELIDKLGEKWRRKNCPTASETAEDVAIDIAKSFGGVAVMLIQTYLLYKLWNKSPWSAEYKRIKAEAEAGISETNIKAEAYARKEFSDQIEGADGMADYKQMEADLAETKTLAGEEAFKASLENPENAGLKPVERLQKARAERQAAEANAEKDFYNGNEYTLNGKSPNEIINSARDGVNTKLEQLKTVEGNRITAMDKSLEASRNGMADYMRKSADGYNVSSGEEMAGISGADNAASFKQELEQGGLESPNYDPSPEPFEPPVEDIVPLEIRIPFL